MEYYTAFTLFPLLLLSCFNRHKVDGNVMMPYFIDNMYQGINTYTIYFSMRINKQYILEVI